MLFFIKMFTVYTFMIDNEKERLEEVEAEKEKEIQVDKEMDDVKKSVQEVKVEKEMEEVEAEKKEEVEAAEKEEEERDPDREINNVMADHQRNIGEVLRSR